MLRRLGRYRGRLHCSRRGGAAAAWLGGGAAVDRVSVDLAVVVDPADSVDPVGARTTGVAVRVDPVGDGAAVVAVPVDAADAQRTIDIAVRLVVEWMDNAAQALAIRAAGAVLADPKVGRDVARRRLHRRCWHAWLVSRRKLLPHLRVEGHIPRPVLCWVREPIRHAHRDRGVAMLRHSLWLVVWDGGLGVLGEMCWDGIVGLRDSSAAAPFCRACDRGRMWHGGCPQARQVVRSTA